MDSFVESLFRKAGRYGELEAFLMREYKRRSAMWADHLGLVSKWPYLDVAEALVERGEASYNQELLAKRLEDIESATPKAYPKRMANLIARWESLSEKPSIDLPDPFLPLQLVFQRGCNIFWPEARMVYFEGGGAINLQPKKDGDLSQIIAHDPWVSEEKIDELQRELAV